MFRPILISLLVVAALCTTGAQAGSPAPTPTRVTVIGDSIASSIPSDPAALKILDQGIDLALELAVCRRLVGTSCPYQGTRPPSLVDLLPTIKIGSTVVVAVGYNDYADTFADTVETVLQALQKEKIDHVLWLTFRAERQAYLNMNDIIHAAAAKHPEMTVVDWNLYSRSHPDWFQDDGLHLTSPGAIAMATLIHKKLDELGLVAAPVVSGPTITGKALPAARVGRPYLVRLAALGGARPLSWAKTAGKLPPGLHLRTNGTLSGTPRRAGRLTPTLSATDAQGNSASRRFVLVVRPAA